MNWLMIGITTIAGGLAMSTVDIRAFIAARKADRSVKFDWGLFAGSFALGSIVAFGGAFGVNVAVGQ